MAQPWSSAACLDRCIGQWRCRASVPPPPRPRPRQATRPWKIGCTSVPWELGATADDAEQTAWPVADAGSEEEGVVCDGCGGAGWLICGFCKGKKNNIKAEESSRVYRRCPTCKAAGFIMCPRCRVYKCITFPESNES